MKVGIIGPGFSGKTTIFNTLTGQEAEVGNYSTSKKSNIGVIKVPDERIDNLSEIFQPKKTTYAEISFVDVAGISSDKDNKEGFSPQLLADMREMDAFAIVVRSFIDDNVIHPLEKIDPMRDYQEIEMELILTDLGVIDKRLEKARKDKKLAKEVEVLDKLKEQLEKEIPLRKVSLTETEENIIKGYRFLSQKPILIVINTGESNTTTDDFSKLIDYCEEENIKHVDFCGKIEMELSQLSENDKKEFLADYGIEKSAQEKFIRTSYEMMNLLSFFTVGDDEVRAWTISNGTPAVKAAGKIHTDLERGFIRAEVISYVEFMKHKSLSKAKDTGTLKIEGKDYVVKDGDIITVRFNI